MRSANLELEIHFCRVPTLISSKAQYVSKASMTDEMLMSRERSLAQGHGDEKLHSQALSLVFCGQIQCSFFYIIGHSNHIFRLWNWPRSPPESSSTNAHNETGFCWSKSRALCRCPTANAILLSHWPHRNRWGETAERSSSCSCCPDPHELWCSKGKMKR